MRVVVVPLHQTGSLAENPVLNPLPGVPPFALNFTKTLLPVEENMGGTAVPEKLPRRGEAVVGPS